MPERSPAKAQLDIPLSNAQGKDVVGKDQYADIAVEYKKSKLLPFRTEAETPSFLRLVKENLKGKES
ncbi:MAG: hypothetical protein CMB97_05085 [Flavobacteriaceae bacterium]|nr:hypothetical protein [Flavobacteriaceae bacterium]